MSKPKKTTPSKRSKSKAWVAERYDSDKGAWVRLTNGVTRRDKNMTFSQRNARNTPTQLHVLLKGMVCNKLWWDWALQKHDCEYRIYNVQTGESIPAGFLL